MASILKQLFFFKIHVHSTSVTGTFIFCISYHCYWFIVMCQCYYTQINDFVTVGVKGQYKDNKNIISEICTFVWYVNNFTIFIDSLYINFVSEIKILVLK